MQAAAERQREKLAKGRDGPCKEVEQAEDAGRVATVYNVEVEGFHTNFVGGHEWGFDLWAHNKDVAGSAAHAMDYGGNVWVAKDAAAAAKMDAVEFPKESGQWVNGYRGCS